MTTENLIDACVCGDAPNLSYHNVLNAHFIECLRCQFCVITDYLSPDSWNEMIRERKEYKNLGSPKDFVFKYNSGI